MDGSKLGFDTAELAETVAGFPYLELEFSGTVEDELDFGGWPGAVLRGAFGWALFHLACSKGYHRCNNGCPLQRECIYAYIFDTPVSRSDRLFREHPQAPHPFVLTCTQVKEHYYAGETLRFSVFLFGEAAVYFNYVVGAVRNMFEGGLGKARVRLQPLSVRIHGQTTVETALSSPDAVQLSAARFGKAAVQGTALTLESPLRLQARGRIVDQPLFRDLLAALLRRVSSLVYYHGGIRLEWPFAELLRAAEQVQVEEQLLRWRDFSRYSGRKKARMCSGGLLGVLRFSENIKQFKPLLQIGELTGIGKQTVFGFGRYRISGK